LGPSVIGDSNLWQPGERLKRGFIINILLPFDLQEHSHAVTSHVTIDEQH